MLLPTISPWILFRPKSDSVRFVTTSSGLLSLAIAGLLAVSGRLVTDTASVPNLFLAPSAAEISESSQYREQAGLLSGTLLLGASPSPLHADIGASLTLTAHSTVSGDPGAVTP